MVVPSPERVFNHSLLHTTTVQFIATNAMPSRSLNGSLCFVSLRAARVRASGHASLTQVWQMSCSCTARLRQKQRRWRLPTSRSHGRSQVRRGCASLTLTTCKGH